MKKIAFLLLALFIFAFGAPLALLMAPAEAADTSSTCYNMTSSDGRAYCLARAKRDPQLCYNVQNADLRSMCLAEVK